MGAGALLWDQFKKTILRCLKFSSISRFVFSFFFFLKIPQRRGAAAAGGRAPPHDFAAPLYLDFKNISGMLFMSFYEVEQFT